MDKPDTTTINSATEDKTDETESWRKRKDD